MDEKTKKICPNCSQLYELKVASPNNRNIPLFLPCGHCMCENCVTNIIKFTEPIECRVCGKDTIITSNDAAELTVSKKKLYEVFPLNVFMIGELVSQNIHMDRKSVHHASDNFIDLKALIENTDVTQGICTECQSVTNKKCLQCAMVLCDACFNKSHKNFVIFKSHVLSNIEPTAEPNLCKAHKGKSLDYYCNDCSKSICMDCFMIGGDKSCKKHNVVSMDEVNESFKQELKDNLQIVDEKFRRLTKTAVDVGNLLNNIENQAPSLELNQMMTNIEQNFSKLLYVVQKHKMEVTDAVHNLKTSEFQSLLKVKADIAEYLKKAKTVMNNIHGALNPNSPDEANLAVLLDESKNVANVPWYLNRDEQDKELKLAVKEDICLLVNDYIHLVGNPNCVYKLCTGSELPENVTLPPAPPAPVFPPELPKDVRQKNEPKKEVKTVENIGSSKDSVPMLFKDVPKYRSNRSKSGSMTSLNSDESQASHQSSRNPNYGFGDLYQSQRSVVQQVQPFAESQHPKQLHEGCQESIFISHIINPHNFFVQRTCHQGIVKELVREFRNAEGFPKPAVNHIAEGKSYLVFNKVDKMWQRCQVIRIDRSDVKALKYHVFCIDFGSTEIVNIERLRLLRPALIQSPPPLAIHCILANCKPKSGSWTTEDSILVQKIIDNKQAIIYIRRIRSSPNYMLQFDVDVTTFVDGVSLAHALVFHDRAFLVDHKLQYPNIVGAMERPKLFISNNDFGPKSVEEVFITYIVSPDKFYVRKRHLQGVYEKLCGDLDEEYSIAVNCGSIYLPEVGMLCVAHVNENEATKQADGWYRVLVTELCGRGKVRAKLPDTGAIITLHSSSLRHINYKYSSLAALAKECFLAGVTPPLKKWSTSSVALLQKFQNKLIELHVEDQRRASIGVVLYDRADEDNIVCVNSEMITYNFAVSFGMYSFNKTLKKPELNPGPSRDKQKNEKIKILQRNDQKSKTLSKQTKEQETFIKEQDDELGAKDKGPLRLEVKIIHYESPSLFYITLEYQKKVFSELFEKLQKYYSKNTSSEKVDWAVGNKCCCLSQKSQTWRRAVIQEINGESGKLFYSDFACTETVPLSSLKQLTPEFMKIGDAATKCHVCGVVSASGADWPSITKEYLKELMDAYPRLFITKLGDVKDNSMPVELWVYHTIEGGALEPNLNEWRCLNKKIIEQGLGIPDKSQPISNFENESNTTDDNMLSFLKSVKGSVSDYLQLDQAKAKSNRSITETEEPAVDKSGTVLINDWLPSEPLPNTEFTGMPTYIDVDGVIFLHDLEQRDMLDFMSQALDTKFNKHKGKHTKWTVGEICIARFCLDNRFYRGRIIQVNNDKTCLVQYVDYGNEEICSFEDLRKNIALYQIPIQAHRCSLSRIKPLGVRWDRQTLDYIHKTIVEKNCLVKVLGVPVDGVTPIDLKMGKLWVSEHLVDFDVAEYVDGTKKVIRRFVTNNVEHSVEESSESDSEPDFIVAEDDPAIQSSASSQGESEDSIALVGKDWNKVIEEERREIEGTFVQFPKFNAEEFQCNILVINNVAELELTIIHDEETTEAYDKMYEAIKEGIKDRPPLSGIYQHKACVAIFNQDNKWYRANILEYSDSKVRVKYVDYGNIDVVMLSQVKEIHEDWLKLPPATLTAANYDGKCTTKLTGAELTQALIDIYIDKGPFNGKIMQHGTNLPLVRLTDKNGELVCQRLIDCEPTKELEETS